VICLATRAPGDSVRPRRLSGVGARPLNFTVRLHSVKRQRSVMLSEAWSTLRRWLLKYQPVTAAYTDIVARFTDEVAALTLAEFISSQGIPCDVAEIWDPLRLERFAIRIQRSRIADLRQTLDLKPVATRLTSTSAQLVAGRLAREGVPCFIAGLHIASVGRFGDSDVPILETTEGVAGSDCMIAVPAQFVGEALRLLNVAPVSEAELTRLALGGDTSTRDSS